METRDIGRTASRLLGLSKPRRYVPKLTDSSMLPDVESAEASGAICRGIRTVHLCIDLRPCRLTMLMCSTDAAPPRALGARYATLSAGQCNLTVV